MSLVDRLFEWAIEHLFPITIVIAILFGTGLGLTVKGVFDPYLFAGVSACLFAVFFILVMGYLKPIKIEGPADENAQQV